jgi:hypothetical protein
MKSGFRWGNHGAMDPLDGRKSGSGHTFPRELHILPLSSLERRPKVRIALSFPESTVRIGTGQDFNIVGVYPRVEFAFQQRQTFPGASECPETGSRIEDVMVHLRGAALPVIKSVLDGMNFTNICSVPRYLAEALLRALNGLKYPAALTQIRVLCPVKDMDAQTAEAHASWEDGKVVWTPPPSAEYRVRSEE